VKIYRKEGDVMQLISYPDEEVNKGDYLLVEDQRSRRGLIIQVIDIQFANIPGILEDILRDVMTEESIQGNDVDPLDISSQVAVLKDTKLLVCKIRGALEDGRPTHNVAWLPSRINSSVSKFPIETLTSEESPSRPIHLGAIKQSSRFIIDAKALDGRLNIVTGKKGTGKSHLSKLLAMSLLDHGAPCLILDVNGEYTNLTRRASGQNSPYEGKITVLTPRLSLRFTLAEVGLGTIMDILLHALDLPGTSARVFARIWRQLEQKSDLTLKTLGEAIASSDCHESVRDALQSRYNTLVDTGIFTDDASAANSRRLLERLGAGGAVVVNMKNQSFTVRRIVVELLLSKITELLSCGRLRAVFLFAEEAHLYLRETYWDDIVTRMRHLGIFTTFITNQPDTIQESIYRQADNIFLFNFTNERDLDVVSRAAKVDGESVRLLVKDLPTGHCLAIGDVVRDFPIVVSVRPLDVETLGGTRFFFEENRVTCSR
jgi:DNA helicase HerA-like ATPase